MFRGTSGRRLPIFDPIGAVSRRVTILLNATSKTSPSRQQRTFARRRKADIRTFVDTTSRPTEYGCLP